MKKIYVAYPYGGNIKNKEFVERFIKKLTKDNKDFLFLSPIHCFGYMYDDIDYINGMEFCLELLKTCDLLLIPPFPEFRNSTGCCIEYGFAKGKNIPIIDWLDVITKGLKNAI